MGPITQNYIHEFNIWNDLALLPRDQDFGQRISQICDRALFWFEHNSTLSTQLGQEECHLFSNYLQSWMNWPRWKSDLCAQELANRWKRALWPVQSEEVKYCPDREIKLKILIQSTKGVFERFRLPRHP